jgi:preprotein translocase subunit YajC
MNLNVMTVFLGDAAPPAGQPNSPGWLLIGYVVIFGLMFYFAIMRPQSKRTKDQANLLKTIRPNDQVTTTGGIVGTVVSVKDETLIIRSADTKLEVVKSSIGTVVPFKGSSES